MSQQQPSLDLNPNETGVRPALTAEAPISHAGGSLQRGAPASDAVPFDTANQRIKPDSSVVWAVTTAGAKPQSWWHCVKRWAATVSVHEYFTPTTTTQRRSKVSQWSLHVPITDQKKLLLVVAIAHNTGTINQILPIALKHLLTVFHWNSRAVS